MISSDQSIWLVAIIVAAVTVSLFAEKLPVGRLLSGTLIVMCLGFLLVNLDVIPSSAPIYGHIYSVVVPVALPLFLYEAKWKAVVQETGRLIYLFLIAAIGVVAGALLAVNFVDVGQNATRWAGVFAASYIGGAVNFVAVSSSLELPAEETAVALAADTIVGMCFLLLLVALPAVKIISRIYPEDLRRDESGAYDSCSGEAQAAASAGALLPKWGYSVLGVAVSVGIFVAASTLSALLGLQQYTIILVTIIALLLANLFPDKIGRLKSSYGLGVFAMLAFFFVIGASANLSTLLQYGTVFALFISVIVATHFVVVLLAAKILKYRVSEIVITSCACALGPTVAAGIAAGKQWRGLVTPGILLGVLGYSVANFIGLGVALYLGG